MLEERECVQGPRPWLYSSRKAVEVTGVHFRRLDYWARVGVVIPVEAAHGIGSERRYSYEDLLALLGCSVLPSHSSCELRKEAVAKIREAFQNDISECVVRVGPCCLIVIDWRELASHLTAILERIGVGEDQRKVMG